MKTLDEVIAELEDENVFADALHYLKEYQGYLIGKEINEAFDEAFTEIYYNSPLTWDELKTMEGKPVWIEQYWYPMEDETGVTEEEVEIDKYWAVIDYVQVKRIHFVGKNLNMGLSKSELDPGKHGGWQAYRKERS